MNKIFSISTAIFLLTGLLTSCASTVQLEPGAENVKVMTGAIPKSCQLRGNVGVSQTDIYGPTHKSKQNEQINTLRNQAARMGANVVSITSHQTTYYAHPEYIISEGKAQRELGAHAMNGKAYRCSPQVVNQLSQKTYPLSDVRLIDE
jgi:hypothetical protein